MKVVGKVVTQMVNGSLPICSVVKPCVLVTLPGTVTGTAAEQVLSVVETVTPVMVLLVTSNI